MKRNEKFYFIFTKTNANVPLSDLPSILVTPGKTVINSNLFVLD